MVAPRLAPAHSLDVRGAAEPAQQRRVDVPAVVEPLDRRTPAPDALAKPLPPAPTRALDRNPGPGLELWLCRRSATRQGKATCRQLLSGDVGDDDGHDDEWGDREPSLGGQEEGDHD